MKKLVMIMLAMVSTLVLTIRPAYASEIKKINTYKELPYTTVNKMIEVDVSKKNDTYEMKFNFNDGKDYWLLETKELPHSNNEHWKGETRTPRKMVYYTTEANERMLYYDFQNKASDSPVLAEINGQVNGFRPHIIFNIDKSEIDGKQKFEIYGTTGHKDDFAYADVVLPIKVDDLFQITVAYDYQTTSSWGIKNGWKKNTVSRYKGGKETYGSWGDFLLGVVSGNVVKNFNYIGNVWSKKDHITELDNVNDKKRNDYLKDINKGLTEKGLKTLTKEDLYGKNGDNSIYRIMLDYHHDMFQTKLEVSGINVTEILYTFKGEYYHIASEDIASYITGFQAGTDLDDIMNFFKNIASFLKKNGVIVAIVIAALIFGAPLIMLVIAIVTMLIKLITIIFKLIIKSFKLLTGMIKWAIVPKKNKRRNYK